MKRIIFFLLITFNSLYAQLTPEWVARTYWGSSGGVQSCSMAVDDSLNVYVTGSSGQGYGTAKYNSSGVEIWRKIYSEPLTHSLIAFAIAVDKFHNVYITGRCFRLSGLNTTLTVKYNSVGTQEWAKHFEGNPSSTMEEVGSSISVDSSDNVIVTGYTYSNLLNSGKENNINFVVKYNPDGDTIWVNRLHGPVFGSYGESPSMTTDSLDNIYVACVSDFESKDIFYFYTIKYDSSGSMIWSARHGITELSSVAYIDDLSSMGSGQYLNHITVDKTLNVYTSIYDNGVTTLKYDNDGSLQWAKSHSAQYPVGIEVDNLGNVYVAAEKYGSAPNYQDYLTFKYDPSGQLLWSKNFNGLRSLYDHPKSMALDNWGNVYVTGTSYMAQDSTPDYCTVKYDSSGNLRGIASYDGSGHGYDRVSKIVIDKFNDAYITGGSESASTFDYTTIKYSTLTIFHNPISQLLIKYYLSQNYPNPFNPVTVISYQLAVNSFASLRIYDALGKEVATLVNENKSPGKYSVQFDGSNFASGVYYYKLESGNFSEVKKMILLK